MTDSRAIPLLIAAAMLPGLAVIAFSYRGPLLKPVFLAATLYVERDNPYWLGQLPPPKGRGLSLPPKAAKH